MSSRWTALTKRLVSGDMPEPVPAPAPAPVDVETPGAESKEAEAQDDPKADIDVDDVNKSTEYGVAAARALTEVWTMKSLIFAYVLIWIVSFVQAFASSMIGTLSVYVLSDFDSHSLTPTVSIVANVLSGLIKLPYSKLMNIWGRPQAYAVMIGFITLGIVLMAASRNVGTYAAAQAFFYVGYTGVDFTTTIFIADTSSLKSRAFMIAFAASPYLATTFAYGPATEQVLEHIGFRWGIGMWAIIYPAVTGPLCLVFYLNQRKAEKMGLVRREASGRTLWQSVVYYIKEFDIIGLLLVSGGLALFLLAFAIYSYQASEWRSPIIICFLIFGGLLVVAFTLWERYLAPVTFIPWGLIANRTVFFTYTMVASIYTAWYMWDSYFYSFLVVVFNQSVTDATYITNIYTMGSCFISLVMGAIIRFNGRLKWLGLYFGVPLTILGVGLMIHFRQPSQHIGYIVMCQIFVAFGGGILVICEQMTVMAVSTHENIPAVLAMEGAVAYVAMGIGEAIAAAMWTGIFPHKLAEYLPAEAQANLTSIYGDITVQTSYAVGTPTRDAIDRSYGETQKLMLIAATCMYSITLVSVLLWKDVNVKTIKQLKGLVW